jgi:hypothetical protein
MWLLCEFFHLTLYMVYVNRFSGHLQVDADPKDVVT